jgi:hypothetical protein
MKTENSVENLLCMSTEIGTTVQLEQYRMFETVFLSCAPTVASVADPDNFDSDERAARDPKIFPIYVGTCFPS